MDAREIAKGVLMAAGLLVYDPGEHIGECKAPYVVLRYTGTYASIQSRHVGSETLEARCYVPLAQYSALKPLKQQVKKALRPLAKQLRPNGHEGADTIEEAYKAHSATVEYDIMKTL